MFGEMWCQAWENLDCRGRSEEFSKHGAAIRATIAGESGEPGEKDLIVAIGRQGSSIRKQDKQNCPGPPLLECTAHRNG